MHSSYLRTMFFNKHLVGSMLLGVMVFLASCASPKPPTGGLQDKEPPKIVESESTPNHQTNFHEQRIMLTFDEWFTLKDVFSQVVISPLMPHDPDIKQKGKSVIITLPDSLREETTYTINFGSAIADLHEGNILQNYAFVFSTGSVLDSAQLSGRIINAVTLAPADGVLVMLYPTGEDSAVYLRKPEYVSRTNKEGKWSLSNIRADSFDVVALKDENLNFLYDQDNELFGWFDHTIYTLTPKGVLPDISIFPKEKTIALRDVSQPLTGWMKLTIEGPAPKPLPLLVPSPEDAVTVWDNDTLQVWYSPKMAYDGKAILGTDTIRIRPTTIPAATQKLTLQSISGRLHPNASAVFTSRVALMHFDTSKIILLDDSSRVMTYDIHIDSVDRRMLIMDARWRPNARHALTLLPGALRDAWDRTNDTIRQSIIVNTTDQFGDLTIVVDGLDSMRSYVLLVKSGEKAVLTFRIDGQSTTRLHSGPMAPGKYGIEVIEDRNHNGIWDTGDYRKRRQPERKRLYTPEPMRAAWELETTVTWQ